MAFHAGQPLNQWVVMLDAIYGGAQNYAKTPYEIHAHLTEVCGIFAKHVFKKKDIQSGIEFLPKIFAWATALLSKMRSDSSSLEDIILRKFPGGCSYCLSKPCACWRGEKPTAREEQIRQMYYRNKMALKKSPNDFQLLFREIYAESWLGVDESGRQIDQVLRRLFIRLVEEVAEVGEAIRFHHLYPDNFDNELADVLAWWFAIVSTIPNPKEPESLLLAEDCLWQAYPGQCRDCQMIPCLCRPGPVRQLMSRPIPGYENRFDPLTLTYNQTAYNEDIKSVGSGNTPLPFPSACVRIDVDDFKSVNDAYGHSAGDEALRHIAAVIRRTVRERDRVYRISGDEFGVLCGSFTEEEAAGAMRRVCAALRTNKVRWVSAEGIPSEFNVSVSIGVAEFQSNAEVAGAFDMADKAAYASKKAGKGTVSRASAATPDGMASPSPS